MDVFNLSTYFANHFMGVVTRWIMYAPHSYNHDGKLTPPNKQYHTHKYNTWPLAACNSEILFSVKDFFLAHSEKKALGGSVSKVFLYSYFHVSLSVLAWFLQRKDSHSKPIRNEVLASIEFSTAYFYKISSAQMLRKIFQTYKRASFQIYFLNLVRNLVSLS